MAASQATVRTAPAADDALFALVAADGSAAHGWPRAEALGAGREAARNMADAIHHLCLLHGRHPGVVDHAAVRATDPALRRFLFEAADGFAAERALMTRLAVAVGPLPSTPGQADSEAAVLHQQHAIDMLGLSDRQGCALGAALALLADWVEIRRLLDLACRRLGIDPPPNLVPAPAELAASVRASAPGPAVERAMLFGAQQIVAQHRGLWDLLEARAIARAHY